MEVICFSIAGAVSCLEQLVVNDTRVYIFFRTDSACLDGGSVKASTPTGEMFRPDSRPVAQALLNVLKVV